jgi:asparagine synthase (glutamine-hydrolysing)
VCGIAGAYQQVDGERLARVMSDRIAHRGPDAAGLQEVRGGGAVAHLAHRRLSIIDLTSAANQPLVKDGLHLSYNGEVYNFAELRTELERAGATFVTRSDTEVVLEALRHWGTDALARLRGMFALALFDARRGTLLLARDPLGIKPLYVMPRGQGVLFSSELKAIVAAVGRELSVNRQALVASTLFYFVPEEISVFDQAHKLTPGTWAEYHPDGTVRTGVFWDRVAHALAALERAVRIDPQQRREALAATVEASVAGHLVADVPVASFLSGGLDSSLVTAIAARHTPQIEAYTITFREQDQRLEAMPDDATYARKMAAHLGIRLHEIEISPDVVDLLPRIVDTLDEPIGDPGAINTVLMCEAARAGGVKVLLSGMGADELFGGYRKHLACLLGARYQRLPRFVRTGVIARGVQALPVTAGGRGLRYARWAKRFLSFASLAEEAAFRRSYTLYDPEVLTELLPGGAGGLGDDLETVLDGHAGLYATGDPAGVLDHVNRMCLTDARLFLPALNLTYTDRASMAASTEVRTPLVDIEVFDAAFSFTGAEKIQGRAQKVPLREAARAWLPEEVVDRPKASFGAPLRAWVSNDLGELIDDVLLGGDLVGSGFLEAEAVRAMVSDQRSGRSDESKQLWQLLSMELWLRGARAAGVAGP